MAIFMHDIAGSHTEAANLASVAAATATESHPVFVAPFACKITKFHFTAQAAVTGDSTNTKNLNVVNKGAAGAGTTEIGNLDLVTGTDLVAFDVRTIDVTDTVLAALDVVALEYQKVGTGVLVPELQVMVEFVGD